MDQSKALHKLLEAADLVGMIEDLTEPNRVQALSPASWTGMRITLRSIRDAIMESHNTLAKDLVERARVSSQIAQSSNDGSVQTQQRTPSSDPRRTVASSAATRSSMASPAASQRSGNLKSTIERFVD